MVGNNNLHNTQSNFQANNPSANKPPKSVENAATMLNVCAGLVMAHFLLMFEFIFHSRRLFFYLSAILFASGVLAFIASMISKGKNWARIAYIIMLFFAAYTSIINSEDVIDSWQGNSPLGVVGFATMILHILAVIFLFQEPSNKYFSKNNSIGATLSKTTTESRQTTERRVEEGIAAKGIVATIEKAYKLAEHGIISREEFEARKQTAIKSISEKPIVEAEEDFLWAVFSLVEKDILTRNDLDEIKNELEKAPTTENEKETTDMGNQKTIEGYLLEIPVERKTCAFCIHYVNKGKVFDKFICELQGRGTSHTETCDSFFPKYI